MKVLPLPYQGEFKPHDRHHWFESPMLSNFKSPYRIPLKVVIVGDEAVGKTSFVLRMIVSFQ
jgi:GTPase SAR1 family protein